MTPEAVGTFLADAARYFENRDTNGEDMAYWANTFNAENCRKVAAEHDRLRAQVERLEEALLQILQWSDAYPETVFREPDLNKMRELLAAGGMPTSLDAAHGTWGRRITEGIGKIARTALQEKGE